ncbi:MAG: T9SS type A sorting domain-containing protein [Bacteroidota bacterium]
MKKVVFLSMFFVVFQISQGAERVAIDQGFENYTFFTTNLSPAGYTQNNQVEGYWGVFNATQNVTITDTKAYQGTYSLKINRHATTQTNAVGKVYTALSPTGLNKVEIQAYRPTGSEFTFVVRGYNSSNVLTTVAQLSTGDNIGKFFVKNATAANLRTTKLMPANVWVLLRIRLNWTTKKINFEYDLDGVTTSIYELDLTGENLPIDRIELGAAANGTSGWSIYFDNYKMTEDGLTTDVSYSDKSSNIMVPSLIKDMLKVSSPSPIKSISLFNMNGALITREYNVESINVSSLPKGIFIAEVENMNGIKVRQKTVK